MTTYTNQHGMTFDAPEDFDPDDCDVVSGYHAPEHTCGLAEGGDGEKFGTWPEAATATPPLHPFEFDRHTYTADSDAAWRKQNGLA